MESIKMTKIEKRAQLVCREQIDTGNQEKSFRKGFLDFQTDIKINL